MTNLTIEKVQTLTAKLTLQDIKEQLMNPSLDFQVSEWLMDELESRITEEEFISFCDSF